MLRYLLPGPRKPEHGCDKFDLTISTIGERPTSRPTIQHICGRVKKFTPFANELYIAEPKYVSVHDQYILPRRRHCFQ